MTQRIEPLCDLNAAASAGQNFDTVYDRFAWNIPDSFNVAEAACRRHANGSHQLALIAENESGGLATYSFDQLNLAAAKLATVMHAAGVGPGDRVAVILPQRVETALLHLAAQQLGAVSLPLSVLFGDEALHYRLQDSGTSFLLVADERFSLIDSLRDSLPHLTTVLRVVEDGPVSMDTSGCAAVDNSSSHQNSFWQQVNDALPCAERVASKSDDAAFLLYTSGTTGPPKGALVPQRALLGNLTGFECSHDGFPQAGDVVFTPADWAWTGGLLDGLIPAWYYGVPVVAYDYKKFVANDVLALMSRHKVTCAFIPPTALKMMRNDPAALQRHPLALRSIMSAGETVGEALYEWGQETLGVSINEMCGQTEHNYMMGNCSRLLPVKPGSMGKAYPGHEVAIMGADGTLLADGEVGEIVANRNDPVHFLGYWNRPEATASKYTGEWFHTGDLGHRDDQGYLWFQGRADDVISSAGYRIGPGEIENCALTHEAVLQVAAIGVPDPDGLRGDVVKLCVVLREEFKIGVSSAQAALEASLQAHVREHLAAYEYPRLIQFYNDLPMTTTGKVQRNVLRRWHAEENSTV